MARPRVVCVGICTFDLVMRMDQFPSAPGKYRAADRREVGGGVAANAAATVAALGGEVALISCVGDDPTGDRVLPDLVARGVDIERVSRIPGGRSPLSVAFVDASGERWIVSHASPDLFDRAEPPADAAFDGADGVLADMRWPAASTVAFAAARRRGIPAVLDCDHDPRAHPEVVAGASHAVFALRTLTEFAGVSDPVGALHEVAGLVDGIVMATDGPRGVHWLDGGTPRHAPSFEVDVVDTLGAGDVFHGAFVLALARGRSLDEAVTYASAAAALKCTRFGGRDGIPSGPDVAHFLESRP